LQSPWRKAQIISTSATGPATIFRTDFGGLDIIVQECLQSVIHYWLDLARNPNVPWDRGIPILTDPFNHPNVTNPRKIVQLTGNVDRSRNRLPTPNQTGANSKPYKVFGTDLGSSFVYLDRSPIMYFLFGDTRTCPAQGQLDPDGAPDGSDLKDSIACTTDWYPDPQTGIHLEFIGRPTVHDIT
jgi:hypothetical protein